MNWEEKFAKIKELSPSASLCMREPGNWYVSDPGVMIRQGSLLGSPTEQGKTPADAVGKHWQRLTNLKAGEFLCVDDRRAFWTGSMWMFRQIGDAK